MTNVSERVEKIIKDKSVEKLCSGNLAGTGAVLET